MSNIGVSLYGAVPEYSSVPEIIGKQELVSLTGSASILTISGKKILIDIGLFQGGEGSDYYNRENIKFINDLDAVFITHSHIDHIGRLPLLYKLGFRGPIYMTGATKEITYEMLLDCVKIQEGDAIIRLKKSEPLVSRLKKSLKLKSELVKKKRLNDSEQNDLKEIEEYLKFYKIESEHDIEKYLSDLKQTLYKREDVDLVMKLINIVEHNMELYFETKIINAHNNNREDQDDLNNFPSKIADGFNNILKVDKENEFKYLKKKWVVDLINEVQKLLKDKTLKYNDINLDLSKYLQEAFTFCNKEYVNYLNGINNYNNKGNKSHKKSYDDRYIEYKKILDFYGIKSREDINRLYINTKGNIDLLNIKNATSIVKEGFESNSNLDNTIYILNKLINIFDLKLPFDTNHIDKAIDRLVVLNKKSTSIQDLSFIFTDAAHLVGASSVTFTSKLIRKKVKEILDIDSDSISVFFSGDMGRIKDNRLGRPQLPAKPVNYLQIESTYGGRNHRNREESVKELIDMIEKSEGNVLISVFSQQRLQEILLTIYEEKQKRGEDFLDYDILVDGPLGEKVTDKYIKFKGDVYEPLKKGFYRFLGENEWQLLYMDQIEQGEDFIVPKKSIILSSSGMMDGGAITNHLPFILTDPKATLLAPGYLSRGTLGNEIIWGDKKYVTVDGTKCEIKCNKKFIDGFSSHIGHDEITQYIDETLYSGKLKNSSTIALTHGIKEGQLLLKSDIEKIILNYNKYLEYEGKDKIDVVVTIPEKFKVYDVIDRKINDSNLIDDDIVDLAIEFSNDKLINKKPNIPKKVNELEYVEVKKEQEKIPQEILEEIERNKKEILQVKLLGDIISKRRKAFTEKYLDKLLLLFKNEYINRAESKISKLSVTQRKEFYYKIDKKLTRTDNIDKQVNNIGKKNTKLKLIIDDIINFFKTEKQVISNKINDIKKLIEQLELDKNELKSRLYDLENFKGEKDADYKKKLSDLRNRIRSKDKKIKIHENEIKNLKNVIVSTQNEIYRESKSLFSDSNLDGFKEIYNNLLVEYNSDLGNKLNELFEKNIKENDKNIYELNKEKKHHISINMKKRKANFGGRNLYEELYDNLEKEIDLVKLQLLINEGFFNTQELSYINSKLSIIKSSDGEKRNKVGSMNHLISYFKEKRNENRDRGINFIFFIDDLNKRILKLFNTIFEKEEFNNSISEDFDIYLFLRSKMSLREYISTKYNLEKLEGIDVYLKEFDEKQENIDYVSRDLDILESTNTSKNNITVLKDLNKGILSTRYEVEDILGINRDK
ncbi:MAG: MBL fold metallo-hydrolase [Candidatus Gracilibacteria bacterium]|nr:MBL fold metallo-hydrolase [Candidatus Gracilibacteria bacterium]